MLDFAERFSPLSRRNEGLVVNSNNDNHRRTIGETNTGVGTTSATGGSATVTITGSEQSR